MDPTRNPAEDPDFDFDAWVRWQSLKSAWHRATGRVVVPTPRPEPETVYLLPVPN
jgi:hypothetical protein